MRFEEWIENVPEEIRDDSLWHMQAYRYALFLADLVAEDGKYLQKDDRTRKMTGQLVRAVGSIGANLAEGYSRRSAKDRARLYEYALGSAREARHWYYQARMVLPDHVVTHRMKVIKAIVRLLLTMIPQQRGKRIIAEPTRIYDPVEEEDAL